MKWVSAWLGVCVPYTHSFIVLLTVFPPWGVPYTHPCIFIVSFSTLHPGDVPYTHLFIALLSVFSPWGVTYAHLPIVLLAVFPPWWCNIYLSTHCLIGIFSTLGCPYSFIYCHFSTPGCPIISFSTLGCPVSPAIKAVCRRAAMVLAGHESRLMDVSE